jgi:hypothetical protein
VFDELNRESGVSKRSSEHVSGCCHPTTRSLRNKPSPAHPVPPPKAGGQKPRQRSDARSLLQFLPCPLFCLQRARSAEEGDVRCLFVFVTALGSPSPPSLFADQLRWPELGIALCSNAVASGNRTFAHNAILLLSESLPRG